MRLTERERDAIIAVFRPFLEARGGQLYLFGSRVDDRKRGGDIDLLVVLPEREIEAGKQNRVIWSEAIQLRIGEQRIDITLASDAALVTDPFLISIDDEKLRLL